ncbi:pectinesterase [Neltuma alba]|uniref:pectinesterase n=1 Tax=Neltuma alba TaxID=207710 RepID=UPI0010A4363F|nr:pectinesterase-like [Prosopis alba]XP_028794901.1 pectinesterase-like [Prosopis alba]
MSTMHHLKRTTVSLALVTLLSLLLLLVKATESQEAMRPHSQEHLQAAHSTCQGTLYPDLCVSTLASFPDLASKSVPQRICSLVNHTMYEVRSSSSNCTGLRRKLRNLNPLQQRALDDCLQLFDHTEEEFKTSVADLSQTQIDSKCYHHSLTLLSGAMTNVYTCLYGFADGDPNGHVKRFIQDSLYRICHHVSNSLAMLKNVQKGVKKQSPSEAFPEDGKMKHGFPSWLTSKDRKLLQAAVNETKFDLVVAKDGSGNFTTIGEAVAAAPNSTKTRFVIHIKAGAYFENVDVIKKKTNLMFVGDGIGKTVVKASRNVVDGWTTFQSATVAVVGDGFIAKGITIENSAGPSKHQAVALRNGADLSAFYRCSFVGYQDTLYVHSLRQFYRECDIYGTVDFIFGNAAAVLQNCNLYARKPNDNQKNLFTAQGREDPNQNTGISIINSKVAAASDLIPVKSSFKTYLGRPWKLYSRTVYSECFMEDLIDPAGWLEWNGSFALDTLYYGEYRNRGPGSNTTGRVNWKGYRVINSSTEASQFTVAQFIQGPEWLNSTGIPFFPGLAS